MCPVSFTVRMPIRFSDIDSFDHVNHARYLSYCEDHRLAALAAMRSAAPDAPPLLGLVVRRIEVDYLMPALLADGEVEVQGSTTHVGRTSFRIRYDLSTGRGPCATLDTVLVHVGADGAPTPLHPGHVAWLDEHRS